MEKPKTKIAPAKPNKKYLDNFSKEMNTVLDGLISLERSACLEDSASLNYSIGWMNAVMIHKSSLSKKGLEMELQHAKDNLKAWEGGGDSEW